MNYRGVTPRRKANGVTRYEVQLRIGHLNHSLGIWDNEEDAARAYDNATYYLFHAGRNRVKLNLNFPSEYGGDSQFPQTPETILALDKWRSLADDRDFSAAEREDLEAEKKRHKTFIAIREGLQAELERLEKSKARVTDLLTLIGGDL